MVKVKGNATGGAGCNKYLGACMRQATSWGNEVNGAGKVLRALTVAGGGQVVKPPCAARCEGQEQVFPGLPPPPPPL